MPNPAPIMRPNSRALTPAQMAVPLAISPVSIVPSIAVGSD